MAANSLPDNVVNNRDILGSAKLYVTYISRGFHSLDVSQSPVNVFVNTEEVCEETWLGT